MTSTLCRLFQWAMAPIAFVCLSCTETTAPMKEDEPANEGPVSRGPLAFVSNRTGSWHIYLANADGSAATRLTPGEKPAWSPDGRRIAFHRGITTGGVQGIYVINADGSGETRIRADGGNPAWSPDGSRIVFNTWVGVQGGIFVMNADGSSATMLVGNEFENEGDWVGQPTWSPDGRSIAFIRAGYDTGWAIYIMDAGGSEPHQLPNAGSNEPSWSPDGSMLAFESRPAIGTVRLDGSDTRYYAVGRWNGDPDWSPDGRSLLFNTFTSPVGDAMSAVASRMRIYVVSREDGSIRQLIADAVAPALPSYWDHQAVWSRVSGSNP